VVAAVVRRASAERRAPSPQASTQPVAASRSRVMTVRSSSVMAQVESLPQTSAVLRATVPSLPVVALSLEPAVAVMRVAQRAVAMVRSLPPSADQSASTLPPAQRRG